MNYEELFIGLGLVLLAAFLYYAFLKGRRSPLYQANEDMLPTNYIGLWSAIICCVIAGVACILSSFN